MATTALARAAPTGKRYAVALESLEAGEPTKKGPEMERFHSYLREHPKSTKREAIRAGHEKALRRYGYSINIAKLHLGLGVDSLRPQRRYTDEEKCQNRVDLLCWLNDNPGAGAEEAIAAGHGNAIYQYTNAFKQAKLDAGLGEESFNIVGMKGLQQEVYLNLAKRVARTYMSQRRGDGLRCADLEDLEQEAALEVLLSARQPNARVTYRRAYHAALRAYRNVTGFPSESAMDVGNKIQVAWRDAVDNSQAEERERKEVIEEVRRVLALTPLTEREREVLKQRFVEGKTLEEVGKHFGRTRARISGIETKALQKASRALMRRKHELYWDAV